MKKKKTGRYAAGVVLVVMLVLGGFIGSKILKMGKELQSLQYAEIDMNQVADGLYTAQTETMLVKAEVRVNVKDHKIKTIDLLKHECVKGKPAEVILDEMVKNNTYTADVVSGATVSSKVIQNAVNKALKQGMED